MKGRSIEISTAIIILLVAFFLSISYVKAQSTPSNKNSIYFITDTATNFDNLIARFKGKVIYVDVWATWCNPCRHELQKKEDTQAFADFALKNDIVILYICCDKNGSSWRSFIADNGLVGYHILVNPHLNKDFHTTFSSVENRAGVMKRSFYIPRHIIIDKNGMIADSTAANQSDPIAYAHLRKLIDQPAN